MYSQTKEELFSGYEKGIESVIKKWYSQRYFEETQRISNDDAVREALITYVKTQLSSYDSSSFKNAISEAFLALMDKRDEDFENIIAWIKGENPPATLRKKYKIFEKIDKSTAFKMIRSLVQWVQDVGYSGMIVLMDEAEQKTSMSSQQKNILLNNLRELIDECGRSNFKHTMWFYAVPDELFLDGSTGVYQALNQRLETVFDAEINPTGVKLRLAPIKGIDILIEIGNKLAEIYQIAFKQEFDKAKLSESIKNIAEGAQSHQYGEVDVKRRFVQALIQAFNKLRKTGEVVTAESVNM
jgi:succinate dehydrogenase flavin-adding protein (antitoxin of CptAB toxin-antitoxin module)